MEHEAAKILPRTNLGDDYKTLTDKNDLRIFNWELVKADWALMLHAFHDQTKLSGPLKTQAPIVTDKNSEKINEIRKRTA